MSQDPELEHLVADMCRSLGRRLRRVLGGLMKEEFKVHWMIHQRLLVNHSL
jgi:hypothetical protein